MPPTLDLQGLLAEDQWIRRLARRLAGDAQAAEDLAQETWAAALGARGPRPRAVRPWLRGILRNLWIDRRRAGQARDRREAAVARDEALEATGELVAELELRQAVFEALLGLEEPYRRALYLRFFRDQSLASIAAREGLAVSSVHARIQQGLERLRARLDRARGGRRAWAVGLLALAEPARGSWITTTVEVLAMAGTLKVAASVLVVGAGLAWWWLERDGTPRATLAEVSGRSAAAPEGAPPGVLAPATASAERASAEPLPRQAAATRADPVVRWIEGRVLDARGGPVAQVEVGWSGQNEVEPARSRADGTFALAEATPPAEVRCLDPRFTTLVAAEPPFHGEAVVVVAPRAAFAGSVWTPAREPVAGARIVFRVRDALFRELGLQRLGFGDRLPRTTSDAGGRFELADVAGGERTYLEVEAEGFWPLEVALPAQGDPALEVVLEPRTGGILIRGLVLDAHGGAVEDAQVSAGKEIARTDAGGRFELRTDAGGVEFEGDPGAARTQETYLTALKQGLRPARARLGDLDLAAPVVLTLELQPLALGGRVLDPEGRPLAGIVLWIGDPTPFGRHVDAAGERMTVAWDTTIEDELVGGVPGRGTRTDEHGAFELSGLIEREYQLQAFDPLTADRAGPWRVRAPGRGLELVLAREERRGPVAGRLVSLGGQPIVGVRVSARRIADADARRAPPHLGRTGVETDAEGRFAFAELALEGTELLLERHPFFLRTTVLAAHPDPQHLELVEPLPCELQVDLSADPAFADELAVLDAAGQPLETIESFGNGFSLGTSARITDGKSPVVVVKESATTLVLRRGGKEVLRRVLTLDPAQRTTVRP
ncbi:MAG TPA: sigma-70 family RNA polymerase sigma factor [Planctomycetota bacterium]